MKLGYVIRPDGVMGTTTRQAIEKFERERGWPAHGELTPKVLREISLRSGLSLE
jgi:peptidoglycan hydrolase-like protein with peptidoglycan-binding domain